MHTPSTCRKLKFQWIGAVFIVFGLTACGEDGDIGPAGPAGPSEPDYNLALWPQPYQDFILSVGGSRFVELQRTRMHYIDTGDPNGETVLLIHGIPTHAYLWRDVIPELAGKRVIAVDLIGYGRSDRPATLDYKPATQVEFLSDFARALQLQDVHLVTQDLGGVVGLRWASENPTRVKSITMFETIWTTLAGTEALPPPFSMAIGALRSEMGPAMVGEGNFFLADIGMFTANGVSPEDAAVYTYPWQNPDDRIKIFLPSGPLSFPFPESPVDFAFVQDYQAYLSNDPVPKLVLDISPGVLSNVMVDDAGNQVRAPEFAQNNFPNTEVIALSGAGHFVQEDIPAELGAALINFIDRQN